MRNKPSRLAHNDRVRVVDDLAFAQAITDSMFRAMMTPDRLAARVGVHVCTIRAIMQGDRMPASPARASQIAEALNDPELLTIYGYYTDYAQPARPAYAALLRRVRLQAGDQQADIAQLLGTARSAVSGWEGGRDYPSVRQGAVLASHYGEERLALIPQWLPARWPLVRETIRAYWSARYPSLRAFARSVGIPASTVFYWDAGVIRPSVRNARKLARHFNAAHLAYDLPATVVRTGYGKRLWEARNEVGLTNKAVADALGVVRSANTNWETGVWLPSMAHTEALAVLYNRPDLVAMRPSGKRVVEGLGVRVLPTIPV